MKYFTARRIAQFKRYAIAFACCAFAITVQLKFDQLAPGKVRFAAVAIALATWQGGFGPGLLSVVTMALANLYWFIPPRDSFRLESIEDTLQFVSSLFAFIAVSYIMALMRRAQRQAVEYAERKAQFAANVSHEIRTPLNSVLGTITLLRDTKLTDEQRTLLDTAGQATQQLMRLLNNVLDSSKIDSGRLAAQTGSFSVVDVVRKCTEISRPAAAEKQVPIVVDIASDLPAAVWGDFGKLRHVLINLVDNAVKFTDRGEVRVTVAPAGRAGAATCVRFEVSDTGVGIPADAREAIFEPFVQVDGTSSRRHGGTGLGLSISHRLVGIMGGQITVESEEGKGSRFAFTLPFKVESEALRAPLPASASRGEPPRILLAEDNRMNQLVISKMLEKFGCKVDIAADGAYVESAFLARPYDLVLMDCQMPRVDGFEAARRLRRRDKSEGRATPIIAITAHDSQLNRDKCTGAGMSDYICKPVEIDVLADKLKQWLPAGRVNLSAVDEATSTKMPAYDGLDARALRRLEFTDERNARPLAAELAHAFLDNASARIETLRRLLQTGDARGLSLAAHALKSGCALLGASRLTELCAQLEGTAAKSELTPAAGIVDAIGAEINRMTPVLRDLAAMSPTGVNSN